MPRKTKRRKGELSLPAVPGQGPDETVDTAPQELAGAAAADTACLVGELHLRRGEYPKAVAAFTRAIENSPTGDAYQGRARAYRALADQDERKAQEQSAGNKSQ
jgi:uncharacterized protein HemY